MEKSKRHSAGMWIGITSIALVVLFFVSFCIGRYGVPLREVMRMFWNLLFPVEQTWTDQMAIAVFHIRLPRILLACLVGCCLSAAGAAYQGVFQNPMAAPDILGASSGGAFGAALAILLGVSTAVVTGFAFAASLVAVLLGYLLGNRMKGNKVLGLILTGIMISSLFSAGTSFLKLVADTDEQLPAITYWMMGSLSGVEMKEILPVLIPMAVGILPVLLLSWRINVLTLGEEEARTMGVNPSLLRLVVIVCATLMTASSVAVSGMIGWVGLVVPHFARRLVGHNYVYLMPASMLLGAVFLLVVDTISRNLLATEIPIGILTAVIGAPFFLWLILSRKGRT